MKLSSDEARALAFVLGLIALAGIARFMTRPGPAERPLGAAVSIDTLEQRSQDQLERQRALARPLGADERIDVNAAAADELDRLPGVGPALAERIVAERERGGAFDSAGDLRLVPGVGRALLTRLEPHLAFGPGTGLPPRTTAPSSETDVAGAESVRPPSPRRPGAAGETTVAESPRRGAGARIAPSRAPALPLSPGERLDINRATASEWDALPGIGPTLAARIVAKRDSLNGFRNMDDLVRVRGIGPGVLARLKPYLRP